MDEVVSGPRPLDHISPPSQASTGYLSLFPCAVMEVEKPSKRPRLEIGATADQKDMLSQLLKERKWEEAIDRSSRYPEEASTSKDPSPLALACRMGAPYECVLAILDAAPNRLRQLLDSRGTPLHEAIVCEDTKACVIEALLKADEALGSDTARATLLQDVDGFTPLHLLIRRRFQSHIMTTGVDTSTCLMQILEMLVSSCPEAVLIPDRGEYEEPPIVYAIKANIYAPALGSEDSSIPRGAADLRDGGLYVEALPSGCKSSAHRLSGTIYCSSFCCLSWTIYKHNRSPTEDRS